MSIKVINPGAMTTVQDLGRKAFQSMGVRVCGVMDEDSYSAAVSLVGWTGDAVLEMTLFGGTYRFEDDTVFALTGADMQPTLDGRLCPMYRSVIARAGQTLSLGFAKTGCRTYLAVAGGIVVSEVMGSRSTDVKCRIGGFEGRALKAGDVVPVGVASPVKNAPDEAARQREIEARYLTGYPECIELRAIPGPQDDMFTEAGLETFFSAPYVVSDKSDRMGYRLEGAVIESKSGTDIISDGIAFGSVQVSANGLPIVLMADRQTTGGYAKIATVISADLPRLAQCRPGNRIYFRQTSIEEVCAEMKLEGKLEDKRNRRLK